MHFYPSYTKYSAKIVLETVNVGVKNSTQYVCMVYVCTVSLPVQLCMLQAEDLLDPLLQLGNPSPEWSDHVFVQYWRLALRADVPAHASHVFTLPAAGSSLHNVP